MSQTTPAQGGSSISPEVAATIKQSEEWAKTPVGYQAAGGPAVSEELQAPNVNTGALGSLEGTGRAFLGALNPSNWNYASMQRITELGPLGQAETFGPGAYRATAGSLVFAGTAATAALGVGAAEAAGVRATGVMVHNAHHTFGSLGKLPHLQVNWWIQGVKGSGGTLLRIPIAKSIYDWLKK